MPYLIIFAILAAGVYFSLRGQKKDPLEQVNIWPYIKAPKPLDPLEISFYEALTKYLDNSLVVCPKMPLEHIFYIPQNARLKRAMRDKLNGHYADFAICDKEMTLICIIVLDRDNDQNAAFRPALKKMAENAGVQLFIIGTAYEYTSDMFSAINELYRGGSYH